MTDKPRAARAFWRGLPVATALCLASQVAVAQTQSAIVRGQGIAERACAGCHALEGSQGSVIQGVQVPSFRTIAGRGWTAERLQTFIATPHRPMPGIPLEMAEIRDLIAYIQSLH
jgi:mono/diheme cytochrome c family protein